MTQTVVRSGVSGNVSQTPGETLRNAEKYPHLVKYADPVQRPAREIVGREVELGQMMASLNRPELSNILLIAPPGSGKLLPLDTPIPTPEGWTTMGELAPGDMVLGQDGKPTKVSYVSEVEDTPELYELTFSDDSTQIACADHQWLVNDWSGDSGDSVSRVMTTQEMVDAGVWPDDENEPVYDITFSDPLVLPEKDFEIGPEVYGFALGAMDHVSECRIRPDYLRGSFEQRLALLRGLMYASGRVFEMMCMYELTIKHKGLCDDVYELLRTLGIYPEYDEGFEENVGRSFFFDTALVLLDDLDPEWTPDGTQGSSSLQIVDIQPVATQPGRCIQVDNEDHMYLCGKSFIPTHNTALVQAAKMYDTERIYIELDLSRMIANLNNENEMAARLKALFDEAEAYSKQEGQEIVIFMDEFHQVVQLSAAAVEALKPVLAASGTRGILVIAATTFEEYHEYIAPNQPLDERLQRINLDPADKEMTIRILRGMAERYDVGDQFYDDRLFELMYEWTNRYIPRSTQPRKSIRLLDAMIGWHRYTGELMTEKLLAKMLQQQTGMDLAFNVDGDKIKENLDAKVFSQDAATSVISRRLQLAVADLNDKSRPMFSALFTGSTGTGKWTANYELVPIFSEDGSVTHKRHGDLEVGDYVFDREGNPTKVLGVFPQEKQDIYRVTFTDGRTLDVGGPHLWTVYTAKQRSKKHAGHDVIPMTLTTDELIERGVVRTYPGSEREHLKFFVPANGAVQWPAQDVAVDPYVLGLLIGNGVLGTKALTFSSDDEYTVQRIADSLGSHYKSRKGSYSWAFPLKDRDNVGPGKQKNVQLLDVLDADAQELIDCKSSDRRIPKKYLYSSVEQRWALVRGLFDTDGTIGATGGRFNVSYSTFSKGLAEDVRDLLFSLGVSNVLKVYTRTRTKDDGTEREMTEYVVRVKVGNEDKVQFFDLPRKREIAERAVVATSGRERVKKFDMVGIKSIEKLPEQDTAKCIYVDNDEHLYQAGQHIVTHNTEMTKQLAEILFGDHGNRLIRFDMTEFALESSLPTFKTELTQKVSDMGHAVILFDEIEKANPVITRLLLQILDDGRMRDDHGRQVSFLNCYIIITTNAGSEVYKTIARYNADDQGSAEAIREYEKVIRASIQSVSSGFPPELLGRLDAIVPFQPLSRNTQNKIVEKKLLELRNQIYARHGVKVRFDPRVLTYITEDKVDVETDAGGARAAVRLLNDEVATEIAMFLNRHKHVNTLQVSVQGTMRNEDKGMLKSKAKIVVRKAIEELEE